MFSSYGTNEVGNSLEGFRLNGWFKELGRLTSLAYKFVSNDQLAVTIENVEEDDICPDKLRQFLGEQKVLDDPDNWKFSKWSGCTDTMADEAWTTVLFEKVS